jgi:hypothetical protein
MGENHGRPTGPDPGIYTGPPRAVGKASCFAASAPDRFPIGLLFWTEHAHGLEEFVAALLISPIFLLLERRHRHRTWVSAVVVHRSFRRPKVVERVEFPDARAARHHALAVDKVLAAGRMPGDDPTN